MILTIDPAVAAGRRGSIRNIRARSLMMAVALCGCANLPARAENFRATYALSILGLSIGSAYAKATLQPTSYQVDIGVKLGGVAALVTDAKGAATATGTISGNDVVPTGYANSSSNAQESRTVRMGLEGGAVRALEIVPPFPDLDQRVPVTDAMKRGVLDPVSALVMRVPDGQPLVGPAACNRKLPIYDGLVRFDVALTYVGTKTVNAKGYSGPVTVCAARYAPLAGYKRDSSSTRYMADNKDMEVWLAPFESLRIVVPFHIGIRTSAGTLLINAAEFRME